MSNVGKSFEEDVGEVLSRVCERHGYSKQPQARIGTTPGGSTHVVDWEIWDTGDVNMRALVSCKYQDAGGTAEEKIPYEVIKLIKAMNDDRRYRFAWLVMGGDGWNPGLLRYYTSELSVDIPAMIDRLEILTFNDIFSRSLKIPS
jgi:hypothetical protein